MQAEILDLFPTAVIRYRIDPQQWCQSLKSQPLEHRGSHSYGMDTHILDQYPDLAAIIESCCTDYAQNVLGMVDQQRAQTSWINHSQGEDFTHEHMHSNAVIAACWYWDLPQGQDRIRFHKPDPRAWGVFNMMFDLDPARAARSPWAKTTVEITVETGDLLVWPAWLLHSVPPMQRSGDRWTLAVNTMPRSGWGSSLHEYRPIST